MTTFQYKSNNADNKQFNEEVVLIKYKSREILNPNACIMNFTELTEWTEIICWSRT